MVLYGCNGTYETIHDQTFPMQSEEIYLSGLYASLFFYLHYCLNSEILVTGYRRGWLMYDCLLLEIYMYDSLLGLLFPQVSMHYGNKSSSTLTVG